MSEIKILVVSDSHGDVENMCRAVELVRPSTVLHLGDGWHDAQALCRRYPNLPLEQVPGNCDFRVRESAERLLIYGGKRVLMCHGHTQGVKTDLGMLLRTALEQQADAVLFGHTHKPFVDIRSGVAMLNPGSIGAAVRPSYGTLTIGDGRLVPATYLLP